MLYVEIDTSELTALLCYSKYLEKWLTSRSGHLQKLSFKKKKIGKIMDVVAKLLNREVDA